MRKERTDKMITDLTVGKPEKALLKLSLPMFISAIFQQMYNICDSVIAGQFAGEDALASVGASYPITMIFMAIALGLNIGASVIISQFFGAKQFETMKTAISTSLISSSIISIVLMIFGFIASGGLMVMINTPSDIFADSQLYLNIYIAGLFSVFLYNIATAIFTSLGDSNTPLYFLIGSSLLNIGLDMLFVAVFKWGVAGVGWATFISQSLACVLSLIVLLKRLKKIETKPYKKFSKSMLLHISRIAVPSILQQSFISIGNIFIQSLINSFGSSVIAGYSSAIKLNTFALTSFNTLTNGISSFTAQNIGAGKFDRIKKGFNAGVTLTLIFATIFAIIYFFFPENMMRIFLDSEATTLALQTGVDFLKMVAPFYLVICVKVTADGVLRGAGDMKRFMIATFSDLILRVVLAYVLIKPMGIMGIWTSWPIGWTVAMVLSLSFYLSNKWQKTVTFKNE